MHQIKQPIDFMLNRLFFALYSSLISPNLTSPLEVEAICAPLLFGRKLNGGVWAHRPTRCFNSRRRAACPHAADSPNFMCSNGKTRPHPARCATFSPGAKATTGFSSRRSCHEVTDEVKSCDMMSFSARLSHRAA